MKSYKFSRNENFVDGPPTEILELKIGRLVVQTTALFVMNGFPEKKWSDLRCQGGRCSVRQRVDELENH